MGESAGRVGKKWKWSPPPLKSKNVRIENFFTLCLTKPRKYEIMYIETMAKGAKMTRKDFQLIATVLKASGKNSPMNRCVIKDVAMNFAVELQKTNPRFDVQRFVNACMQ